MLRHEDRNVADDHRRRKHMCAERCDGSTLQTKLGEAEVPKDQRIVGHRVKRHRHHRDPEHHLRFLKRGQVAFERHHHQSRQQSKGQNAQINLRICCNLGLLPKAQQQRL